MKPFLCALALMGSTAVQANPIAPDTVAAITGADILILGEVHDNPEHHLGQAEIITAIKPTAVVFEMLTPQQAVTVTEGEYDDLDALAKAILWADSGWPEFALYAPVFAASKDRPIAGAALPREEVRRAFGESAAAVFGDAASAFGLDQSLAEAELKQRKQMQFDAHCAAMPLAMMGGMVEAQRLRDAHFARIALDALDTYGAPVVVIAGNGHARRDWGMPVYIAKASPDTSVVAVGFVEKPAGADDPRFDLTIPTAPAQRPDPCDAFKKD